jgi:zinc D-Ala-D-Ala dipeptidase
MRASHGWLNNAVDQKGTLGHMITIFKQVNFEPIVLISCAFIALLSQAALGVQKGPAGESTTPHEAAHAMNSPLEQRLVEEGLVDVRTLDPTILVDLEFSRPDNFIGKDVYGELTGAYLRPEAARKLARASELLRADHSNLRILVLDAVRPRSIQHKLWNIVVGTPMQPYIANPYFGSMHNYGAAVDVTLFDIQNQERLDMGTPPYYLGPLAQPNLEGEFLLRGDLNVLQIENRVTLRNAMVGAGWRILTIEWWHFDAFPRAYTRQKYSIIE